MIKQERTTSRESLVLSMQQQQQQQQWVSFSLLTSLLASFSQILSHCNVRASREKSSSGATRKVFASVATTTTTFICSIWLALLCLVVVVVVVVVVNEEKICGKSSVIPLSMSRTHMRSKVETFNKNSLSLSISLLPCTFMSPKSGRWLDSKATKSRSSSSSNNTWGQRLERQVCKTFSCYHANVLPASVAKQCKYSSTFTLFAPFFPRLLSPICSLFLIQCKDIKTKAR